MRERLAGRKTINVLLVLVIVAVSLVLIIKWARMTSRRESPGIMEVPEETRSVTLFFANRDADGLLSEAREIAVGEGLEEQVKGVMGALLQGPLRENMVSAIPVGTEVIQVFWAEETQTIFIDFNRTLIYGHPGGGTGEYYVISMILRTIASNFPQVRRLQFLVDGYPVETIAGHYAVGKPLDIMRWR